MVCNYYEEEFPTKEKIDNDYHSIPQSSNKEINDLTAMLCAAAKILEGYGYDFDENPMLSRWWEDHKKADRIASIEETKKRLQYEEAVAISSKPFNELTDADKVILNREGFL